MKKKQDDMRSQYQNKKIRFYIGNTRDYCSIVEATKEVDYVFHAAALKQVPSCEFFPIEATYTNVIGTLNVVRACVENKVKKVICLSTDKAAYPINAMGMTKALMEKVIMAEARKLNSSETILCCTRYGNVMASRGSVIPLFIKQAQEDLPITVTNPDMTRFMMSLDEAVDLVMYAFENAKQGDLFIQKSPASTVGDIAQAIKDIFHSKSRIQVIGERHGEKLYETLLTREEYIKADNQENYFRVPIDDRGLDYSQYENKGRVISQSDNQSYNSHNTQRLSLEETKNKILALNKLCK